MRLLTVFLALVLAFPLWAKPVSDAQLLQLVDYVGVDYEEAVGEDGQITHPGEYEEMQEFSATILGAVEALPENEQKADLIVSATLLQQLVENKAPLAQVRKQTSDLSQALQAVLNVPMSPKHEPNLAQGQQLFEKNCTSCHGVTGAGDGPLAASLDPAPTNFLDANRMSQLSTFALFNTITLGVDGTSMVSYEKILNDEERWDLAFYIDSLLGKQDAIGVALTKLEQSMKSYEAGDQAAAYQFALSAYLDGFETAEAVIDILDHDKRLEIEAKMMDFRSAIEKKESFDQVKQQYGELRDLLMGVQKHLPATEFSNSAVFFSALVILLREGLESILIVGMLIVMIIKGEKRDLLPAIHAGWLMALVAGALTWWGSHTLISISGAAREITEGVTALVAAAMLLYVGIWIHRNQLAQDWRKYLKEKLSKHVANEARWGLGLLSFLAVYREIFETVLFYEALGMQVGAQGVEMIWAGIGVGLVILLLTVFAMIRYGLRLPLESFFKVSAALIFVFAIIFIGQGIHGLEEAGKVPVWPVPVPRIDLLGIYPNLFGLMLQALVLSIALYFGLKGKK
jgi:high-affinity iron transporter